MEQFIDDFGAISAWVGVSLAVMIAGFGVVDLLTPGKLRDQVSDNLNAALLVASKLMATGIIVGAAVWTAPDDLDEGLVEAALYSATGLVVSAVAFLLLDWVLPARLRHLVNEKEFDPASIVAMGAEISVAIVIGASLS